MDATPSADTSSPEVSPLAEKAKLAKKVLDNAEHKGLPMQQLAVALLLTVVVLILNFAVPSNNRALFGDGGLVSADCTESNPQWETYLLTTRISGCAVLVLIIAAWLLGAAVARIWPCRRAARLGQQSRRRLLPMWIATMLLSMLVLCFFQYCQSDSNVLAALNGAPGAGCSSAQVFVISIWQSVSTYAVSFAVSQYLSGLCLAARHIYTSKSQFKDLRGALEDLEAEVVKDVRTVKQVVTRTVQGGSIELVVKSLTGKTVICVVHAAATVRDVKQQVMDKEGTPVQKQRMIFAGHQLEDDKKLRDYTIMSNSTLILVPMPSSRV
ncbi:unnamed protein product [Polarella glacialis]|uniref:Ubiquitin-like domain-containing protein n=2 Tax=Polarella glacialis TaxID=89957 RepID=A0A813DIZ9_POLGL|nr:unnamed protein product [Polarella glacialis]